VDPKPLLNPRPDRVEPLTVLLNAPELPGAAYPETICRCRTGEFEVAT